ncbi:hypothetical protein AB0C06_30935 [Micromonospora inaquosa]|uniref:Uncharacterized protein n=1 Tax=Micromonospora inaquosa TaxID=2203716 RepID=A0A3N9WLS5_9ACTN|nr:hypothetical protein [Micromonospora inaquosa]RQX01806.1 hypothetical protein DLJ59_17500 [Micromonospora inaquosa]
MPAVVDAVIPSDNGLFLVRDVNAESFEARLAAFQASRIPGTRRGRLCAAAGGILLVRGAHQMSRPRVRIEVLDTIPAEEPPWHWEARATMEIATRQLVVEADPSFPLDVPAVDLPGGPGRYGVVLGHTGRPEVQQEAARVSAANLSVSSDDALANWRSLDGIEQYLIRLWPDHRDR